MTDANYFPFQDFELALFGPRHHDFMVVMAKSEKR